MNGKKKVGMTDPDKKTQSSHCEAILIVEDEPIIRENLVMLLELEGYSVFAASNGEEGLKLLHSMPRPCLILLDLLMPVMNGMEFMEAKSHEVSIATIPVCVVSAVSEKPDMSMAVGFMKKPVELETLIKFVKSHCGAPNSNVGVPEMP